MSYARGVLRTALAALALIALLITSPLLGAQATRTVQDGVFSDAQAVMIPTGVERRFAGAEKSIQKRTNLALVETSGQPAKVTVRAYSTTGLKLAEKTYDLAGSQYLQITDVFGGAGVNLGDGPFQNVEITAQVTSGTGNVVGVASVNDNLSRNPQLFVLDSPGVSGSSLTLSVPPGAEPGRSITVSGRLSFTFGGQPGVKNLVVTIVFLLIALAVTSQA